MLGKKYTVQVPVDVHEDCTWEPGTVVEITHIYDDDGGFDLSDADGETGSFAPCDLEEWFKPEVTSARKINGIEITAKEFAYDGCHKIYLIDSEEDRMDALETGYDLYPIEELKSKFMNSCGLQFIHHWNLDKPSLVPQFENAEFEGFEPLFVCSEQQDEDEGPLYWSNESGWVSFDEATAFTKDEADQFTNLPAGGRWY